MDAPGGLGGCPASVFGLSWHKQPTSALNTTQAHVFLPPKHHQHTFIMLQIDIGCWKPGLEGGGFWPFWHPFCF